MNDIIAITSTVVNIKLRVVVDGDQLKRETVVEYINENSELTLVINKHISAIWGKNPEYILSKQDTVSERSYYIYDDHLNINDILKDYPTLTHHLTSISLEKTEITFEELEGGSCIRMDNQFTPNFMYDMSITNAIHENMDKSVMLLGCLSSNPDNSTHRVFITDIESHELNLLYEVYKVHVDLIAKSKSIFNLGE